MWGPAIKSGSDLDNKSGGKLLRQWWRLGLLVGITFGDFVEGIGPSNPPWVDVRKVARGRTADYVDCVLRASGAQVNGQLFRAETPCGVGEFLKKAFPDGVSRKGLDRLKHLSDNGLW
jgi:hypothetical protein